MSQPRNETINNNAKILRRMFIYASILLAVLGLFIVGIVVSPPTTPNDNALQISSSQVGQELPDGFYLYQGLNQRGITVQSITRENNMLVVALSSSEQRQQAQNVLKQILPVGYEINVSTLPQQTEWVDKFTRDNLHFG